VVYHVGDEVIVSSAAQGIDACRGEVISVLGSQFVIKSEEDAPYGRFFFYNGSKLTKVS